MAFPLSSSKLVVAALAAATVLGAASAAKASVSFTSTVTGPGLAPSFPKFGTSSGFPATGKLTGATINITLTLTPSLVEQNITAPVGTPYSITLDGLVFTETDPYSNVTTKTYDFTADPVDYTSTGLAGDQGTKQTATTPSVTFTSTTVVPAASLSTFVGSGNFSPTFSVSNSSTLTRVGTGQGLSESTAFAGIATITYQYVTPEPASLSLLALSGAGLLLRRRRSC